MRKPTVHGRRLLLNRKANSSSLSRNIFSTERSESLRWSRLNLEQFPGILERNVLFPVIPIQQAIWLFLLINKILVRILTQPHHKHQQRSSMVLERNKITRYVFRWFRRLDSFCHSCYPKGRKVRFVEHMLIRIKNDRTSADEEKALQSS